MLETTLAHALSSDVNWKILELLVVGESVESKIGRSLGVRQRVVKSQLQELIRAGLVSMREENAPGGKPRRTYCLTGRGVSVGFPPRNYEYLSQALIKSLVASLGEDSARVVLRDMGLRMGEDAGQTLVFRTPPMEKWRPASYAEHFVKGFLAEMKTYPRLVSVGRGRVIYEQLNCPFQELAGKSPGLVCDVLDEAVHEAIDKKLGVKSVRLSCRGHGAPVCRYSVTWPKNATEA